MITLSAQPVNGGSRNLGQEAGRSKVSQSDLRAVRV